MTRWHLVHGDLLDVPADVMICSANASLNLTGGVGGALLGRYGAPLQHTLHGKLKAAGKRFARQGELHEASLPEMPYDAVYHAVAIDAFYTSTPEVITDLVGRALQTAIDDVKPQRVALAALATGYGNLKPAAFLEGLRPLTQRAWSPIQDITLAIYDARAFEAFQRAWVETDMPGTR